MNAIMSLNNHPMYDVISLYPGISVNGSAMDSSSSRRCRERSQSNASFSKSFVGKSKVYSSGGGVCGDREDKSEFGEENDNMREGDGV